MSLGPVGAVWSPNQSQAKSEKLAEAAKEFEGLLFEQILRSAREAAQTGEADGEGTYDLIWDFADRQLARAMAEGGGFGLRDLLVKSLDRNLHLSPGGRQGADGLDTHKSPARS